MMGPRITGAVIRIVGGSIGFAARDHSAGLPIDLCLFRGSTMDETLLLQIKMVRTKTDASGRR